MKKKGISLIVLIITCVVIIILGTTIVVNVVNSNIIGNSNVAVLKNDFQTFNDELRLYKSEQLLNKKLTFKPDSLDADYEKITHNGVTYNEGQNIYNILTKLKNSKYDNKVYIEEGKIVVSKKSFTKNQLEILDSIGIGSIDTASKVMITKNPMVSEGEYTTEDVVVTLSYDQEIPAGYVLQYKIDEIDWAEYTSEITLTSNAVIDARLYNIEEDVEIAFNSTEVSYIDKTAPTAVVTGESSQVKAELNLSVTASDDSSGLSKIMYYYKKSTETKYTLGGTIVLNGEKEINKNIVISKLSSLTTYNMYVEVYDNANKSVVTEVLSLEIPDVYSVEFDNTSGTANVTINGGDYAYNNPVVPVGFMAINTEDATWKDTDNDGIIDGWNNGLVIADSSKNEFVWVPVDGTDVPYAKWCTTGCSYKSTSDDTSAIPVSDETQQITTYKGFYIGRYEAGVPANQTAINGTSSSSSNKAGKPVVTKGATVWTNINYSYANINSKKIYNTSYVKSGLITGTQWDTTLKWIQNAGYSVTNSNAWGNHQNSTSPANVKGYGSKQVAGFSEYWKAKNIYDLAGNAFEWSAEIYSSKRLLRGGMYGNTTSYYTAAERDDIKASYYENYISFRVVLYIL